MRLTPAQVGMTLLLGGFVSRLSTGDLKKDVRAGREWLIRVSGEDFDYDPWAWHEHLRQTDAGGYRWSNKHLGMPKQITQALENPQWHQAVAQLRNPSDEHS